MRYAETRRRRNVVNVIQSAIAVQVIFHVRDTCTGTDMDNPHLFIECQKEDWKNHKRTCSPLKGGNWRTIRLSSCLPGMEGMFMSDLSRRGSTRNPLGPTTQIDSSAPPPNIHGSRVFLIKLQYAPSHLYIYDRKRSMKCYFVKNNENRETFDEFIVEMQHSPRVTHGGLKMYRWAKRVGDWDLSVCLDKLPTETIRW